MIQSRIDVGMRRHLATSAPRRGQVGAGLIEVLIAVLVMGVGLLGVAAMQTTALRNSSSALDRSQAVIQTYAILDAMRANRNEALAFEYNTALICAPPAGGSLAQNDRRLWIESLRATLGAGPATCGAIACTGSAIGIGIDCAITVQWDDSRASNGPGTPGSAAQSVTTRTRL